MVDHPRLRFALAAELVGAGAGELAQMLQAAAHLLLPWM